VITIYNKNILISGAGIAGTALAFWLNKFGFNPTIIEYAPELRKGGYAIDFGEQKLGGVLSITIFLFQLFAVPFIA